MQTMNPLNLPVLDGSSYTAPHGVTDEDKATAIAAAMREHGWQGAPIVVLSDYGRAITGSHRLAAVKAADLETVPAVDFEELLAACGIDLWERVEEDFSGDLDFALVGLTDELPADVRDAYGLDIH